MIDHIKVTADNVEEAREACRASDQRDELEVGDETWGILYEGGQRGQMSRYAASGRGAVSFGGDSLWGDWTVTDGSLALLVLDDGDTYVDEEGNSMTMEEMEEGMRSIEIESN